MNDVRSALLELRELRDRVRRAMESLHLDFNSAVSNSRLRLRAWRRTREGPPYAVYWILFNRRTLERFGWQKKQPRFPFRRLKIHTRQNLDDAIYHGMASASRHTVYRFHAKLTALNAAQAAISRGVDGLRKLLSGFRTKDLPKDAFQRADTLLTAFDISLDDARGELMNLELESKFFANLPLRLVFEQDAHHPHGRLRWRWVRDGRPELPLTDRRKRELRLPPEMRSQFTPYELRRRRGMVRQNRLSKIARRLKTRVNPAPDQVRTLLETQGIPLPRRESA